MKLLLISGQTNNSKTLRRLLKKEKYVVDAADGEVGLEKALLGSYDIIVLDWLLPSLNGLEIIKELRRQEVSTPILFLSETNNLKDKVAGLDAGADDYLIRPFVPAEFLAKLRALSRRSKRDYISYQLKTEGLALDPSKCCVTVGQTLVKLSVKETLLLEILIRNHGHVVTKERIFERLWSTSLKNDYANVDLYIFYLRRKIGASYIKTVRGIGYYLDEQNNLDPLSRQKSV